ncbi:uncharacterized protein Tco025E_03732 [Trypanosoma conorhini]|uniref:Uncharacterized protein n=1 Tax=Trypanosoma conorhini TaxID=83891 RepID=A0A3R7LCI7_9TRYP|nr:uncharacterized protein Tco025E_03732 [Trypanosoma conorhini]RNF20841.1 hypothetical protein Tco025E_03732 [Trypanosoma conorhini]
MQRRKLTLLQRTVKLKLLLGGLQGRLQRRRRQRRLPHGAGHPRRAAVPALSAAAAPCLAAAARGRRGAQPWQLPLMCRLQAPRRPLPTHARLLLPRLLPHSVGVAPPHLLHLHFNDVAARAPHCRTGSRARCLDMPRHTLLSPPAPQEERVCV